MKNVLLTLVLITIAVGGENAARTIIDGIIMDSPDMYTPDYVRYAAAPQRPTIESAEGVMWFDRKLSRPIWQSTASSTGWVDASGNPI